MLKMMRMSMATLVQDLLQLKVASKIPKEPSLSLFPPLVSSRRSLPSRTSPFSPRNRRQPLRAALITIAEVSSGPLGNNLLGRSTASRRRGSRFCGEKGLVRLGRLLRDDPWGWNKLGLGSLGIFDATFSCRRSCTSVAILILIILNIDHVIIDVHLR